MLNVLLCYYELLIQNDGNSGYLNLMAFQGLVGYDNT